MAIPPSELASTDRRADLDVTELGLLLECFGLPRDEVGALDPAFYDSKTGVQKPSDGTPVYEGLRPDFVWPKGVPA
jgi:hypothetical protein